MVRQCHAPLISSDFAFGQISCLYNIINPFVFPARLNANSQCAGADEGCRGLAYTTTAACRAVGSSREWEKSGCLWGSRKRRATSVLHRTCYPPNSRHDYDGCFGGAQDSILFENSQIPAMMKELLAGVSVGVFSLGMEPAEKPGVRAPLLKEILGRLQLALDARKDVSVQISYAVYGVSDTSCIDLLSYSRRELHEVETLKKWTPLSPLDSLQQVADSIDQGYSLPCVILVRLLITPCDDKLPILMSTLALADLGFVSSGSPIEKSFSKLCSFSKKSWLSNS